MAVTVLLPDDSPAITGIVGVRIPVHITNSNVFAPDATFSRPFEPPNNILAATAGSRTLADFTDTVFPTASRLTSSEFERLGASLKSNQILVEFEYSTIPIEPWRYQIYSRAPKGSNAHVVAVDVFENIRLALLTYDGTLRKNSGYKLFVLMPPENEQLSMDGGLLFTPSHDSILIRANQRSSVVMNLASSTSIVTSRDAAADKTPNTTASGVKPTVVKRGSEAWVSHNSDNISTRKGVRLERPFLVSTQDRLLDDTVELPRQYGPERRTSGRNPNHSHVVVREDLIGSYKDASNNKKHRMFAGARPETLAEATARGDGIPKLIDINRGTDPTTGDYYIVGYDENDSDRDSENLETKLMFSTTSGWKTKGVLGIDIVVEDVAEADLCGGESLNKILPAILRAFGSNLARLRGEPLTRTLNTIYKSAQVKMPRGYFIGKLRVETTLTFPKDLQFGPYKIWINGHECEYAHATSGCNSYLLDVTCKDYLRVNIPPNAEVVLDVPSLPPEIIGLG